MHSRGAAPLALPENGKPADIAGSLFGTPTTFRTDTEVPVFDLQTETDVVGILGSAFARQPDTDTFRLWEVAGTGHADRHLLGDTAAASVDCGPPVNDGPLHVVAKAAFRHFVTWVEDGVAPPIRAVLITYGADGVERDPDGHRARRPPDPTGRRPGPRPVRRARSRGLRGVPAVRLHAPDPARRGWPSSTRTAPTYVADVRRGGRAARSREGYVLAEDRAALQEAYRHEELVAP